MIGQQLSPVLTEIEEALWEFEHHSGTKPEYTEEGFRAGCKIFMSVLMDKIRELQSDEKIDMEDRIKMVEKAGKGVILYMMQEGRGIGFMNKLKAYKLQEEGMDTVDANIALGFKADQRDFGIGAQILLDLNISKMKLITNNPKKRAALDGYGLEIVENIPIQTIPNIHNETYLKTKRDKMGHELMNEDSQ